MFSMALESPSRELVTIVSGAKVIYSCAKRGILIFPFMVKRRQQ